MTKPEHEILAKLLKDVRSAFYHVVDEVAADPEILNDEDLQNIAKIQEMINELYKKVK